MKNFVWLAAALLLLSFVYPNGPTLPVAPAVAPDGPTDSAILKILEPATAADKGRIRDVYSALAAVLKRDKLKPPARITTTEQWADLQANTLQLAIDTPGKYPGLDEAIETVFKTTVGTDDVLPSNDDTRNKLIAACDVISNTASR
jgi:hypothetical protein